MSDESMEIFEDTEHSSPYVNMNEMILAKYDYITEIC